MKKTLAVSLIAASLTVAGCATDPNNTQKGAAIGAVVGALLGKATGDNDKSRYAWGAAVGAIAGGAIGNYMDKQEEELRNELSDTGVQVVREGDNLRLIMPGDITFATDSSSISPNFNPVLQDVAKVVNNYEKTVLMIKYHTIVSKQLNEPRIYLIRSKTFWLGGFSNNFDPPSLNRNYLPLVSLRWCQNNGRSGGNFP